VSPAAQIRDIEASFAACNEQFSLAAIRHPNKPKVTAVESYEIFPDAEIWANAYDLFRFSERPGERSADVFPVPSSRLNLALTVLPHAGG
jgi:RNA polymerase II-associated factor 1